MLRYPDLSYPAQAVLVCVIVVVVSLLLTRGTIAIYRHQVAMPHQYPVAWTYAQIRFFANVRISIGFTLSATWGILFFASPATPHSWPFGLVEAMLALIVMLMTYAWILLVTPRDWKLTFIGKMSFGHAVGCILVWWIVFLGASLFAIAKSAPPTAERPIHVIGTYA